MKKPRSIKSFRLSAETVKAIEAEARKRELSQAAVVELAVKMAFERKEKR